MSAGREIEGTVELALPKGLYRVRCDDGSNIVASLGGVARQVTVKIIPGDRVLLEISAFDPTRARIKSRI
ncbi:MAG: translation initiation factor IF-1 [Myxococcales bacterium]